MSNDKNPYAEALKRLEAVPESKRYLLSGRRRGRIEGVRGECGCLFGTIVPPRLRNPESTSTYRADFYGEAFGSWADEAFGEDSYPIVAELEICNDRYAATENEKTACGAHYEYMVAYLRQQAARWEHQMKNHEESEDV